MIDTKCRKQKEVADPAAKNRFALVTQDVVLHFTIMVVSLIIQKTPITSHGLFFCLQGPVNSSSCSLAAGFVVVRPSLALFQDNFLLTSGTLL